MTDQTNRQCGPECAEGHLYAYRCALKPPPVSPWTILGVGAESEPAVAAPADDDRRQQYARAILAEQDRQGGRDNTTALELADAVMAVADAELEEQRQRVAQQAATIRQEVEVIRAALDRAHQACAAVPPCIPGTQTEDAAHAAGWNAAMDHVLKALTAPKETRP